MRGRPTDAGLAAALGWSIAALLPLLLVGTGQGPGTTLRALGLASTLGMTVSGVALVLLVRRTWGPVATRGASRTAGVLVVAAALAVAAGDVVTRGRAMDDLVERGGPRAELGSLVGWKLGELHLELAVDAARAVLERDQRLRGERLERAREVACPLREGPPRVEMPDDWPGHPQRKDYPLGGIPVEYKGATIPPPDIRRQYT